MLTDPGGPGRRAVSARMRRLGRLPRPRTAAGRPSGTPLSGAARRHDVSLPTATYTVLGVWDGAEPLPVEVFPGQGEAGWASRLGACDGFWVVSVAATSPAAAELLARMEVRSR
jgi:hypothetical protein